MEENPSDQKVFPGDAGTSGQANAANIHLLNISICFFEENAMCDLCTETNRYANQNGLAGFQDIIQGEMIYLLILQWGL